MTGARAKRRVAILGGGQAALTAALQLSDPRNPFAGELELTIYQLGWRLGGKGATGRPADGPPRILEHGLHNWFGFYDNSFRQIRDVYAELDRPPGAPLATFEEAFEPADSGAFVEWIEGEPLLWEVTNPPNDAKPGEGGLWLDPLQYIAMAVELIERALAGSPLADLGVQDDPHLARVSALLSRAPGQEPISTARELLEVAAAVARRGAEHPVTTIVDDLERELDRAPLDGVALPPRIVALEDDVLEALCIVLFAVMVVLWRWVRDGILTVARTGERRLWIKANFGYACITGAIVDGTVEHGFDVINDDDLRAWLGEHDFPDGGVMLASPLVEAVYCGSFAYPRGDTRGGLDYPPGENMEAGTALRGVVRALLTYKGAFAYRFAAGTADTCYAPTYEVLRARGVRVRFFTRVERLELANGSIERVHVAEQAKIVGGGSYEPLVDIHGLPCWPLQPRWEQLVDGDWFRAEDADFEWPSEAVRERECPFVLERGRDFDDVVLGISIGALTEICSELVASHPAWRSALEAIQTVRTQALQIWLAQTSARLGFELAGRPVTNLRYDEWSPLNVWADFSELIVMEHWPPDDTPHSLGYFCSTMPDEPDFEDQVQADARARRNAVQMLTCGLPTLLPGVLDAGGAFRWDLLVVPDASAGAGPDRLDTQWARANVRPTERYVLSVVGSSRHRLAVHDPADVSNLYLAGDWTRCTLNCGCMEAATMSGMLCANALSGYPARDAIIGIDF